MSLMENKDGIPEFTRIFISVWFRPPSESLDACNSAAGAEDNQLFDGILPIITIGETGTGIVPTKIVDDWFIYSIQSGARAINLGDIVTTTTPGWCDDGHRNHIDHHEINPNASYLVESQTFNAKQNKTVVDGKAPKTNPTIIGINSGGSLYVSFQTNKKPTVKGYDYNKPASLGATIIESYGGFGYFDQGSYDYRCCELFFGGFCDPGYPQGFENDTRHTPARPDATTQIAVWSPEDISDFYFGTEVILAENAGPILENHWNHALISLDLKTMSSHGYNPEDTGAFFAHESTRVSSVSRIFIALNDVNKTEYDLTNNHAFGSKDKNSIVTEGTLDIANARTVTDPNNEFRDHALPTLYLDLPTYTLNGPKISGKNIGIPSTTKFKDKIFRVEMGEMLIFTDTVRDTGLLEVRRAFVTDEGKPEKMSVSEEFMGKKAEIKFHGSSNWKKGRNTGTLGIGSDGQVIQGGQFTTTAKTNRYKPDPSLHGPQKPGEK